MEAEIYFRKRGAGDPVILLHGFPMDHQVWNSFAADLSTSFSVYTPDLPGFGKSKRPDLPFSLDDIARSLNDWIDRNDLQNSVVIGHSLGGYITLAMIRQKPEWFKGFGLFHSTAYADTEEKKESRTKVLKFIDDNGVVAFTSNFIEPLFADAGHPSIGFVRDISIQAETEAVKGYTTAMRDRPDQSKVLQNTNKPVLLIAGEMDKAIPANTIEEQSKLNAHIRFFRLHNAGHMGMIEKKEESLQIVKTFLLEISRPGEPR